MDANDTLNAIAGQPVYVLIFVAVMAFLLVMRQLSLATTAQAETTRAALALVTSGQQEGSRQNERWLTAIAAMNDGFIAAITGQTQAIAGQGTRFDTMDTSLSAMPTLATGAAVSAVSDKVSIGLEILKLLGVDVGELAKHASNPTAASKDKVDAIADKAEQTPPDAAPAAPQPGDEIPVTGEVTGVVKLTATTDTPV